MTGPRGTVTHTEDGEHVATCAEPGCIWTHTSKKDGEPAHELMTHEHVFERETQDEAIERIRQQGMRDHPFEGDGIHCTHWSSPSETKTSEGTLTFSSQCGYPRDYHPEAT